MESLQSNPDFGSSAKRVLHSKQGSESAFREFAKDLHSRPNEHAEIFMRDKLERSYAEELAPRERTEEQKTEILRSCMYPYPLK